MARHVAAANRVLRLARVSPHRDDVAAGRGPRKMARTTGTGSQEGARVDIQNDARRLAGIGTFFIILGWIAVIYAVIAGILWWIDLAQRASFNIFEAFAISAAAIGVPIFAAFVLAGFGYFLRLFALWVASQSR
jgi:hypothetical protein